MKNIFHFLIVFIPLLLISQIFGSPFIFGDGYGYYYVGQSLAEHHNFISESEPEYIEYSGHGVYEVDGKYITAYSVGNAILWLPFLIPANIIDNSSIYNDYYKAFNGHSLEDGLAVQIAACFYLALSILMIFKTLKNLNFTPKVALFSTFVAISSSLVLGYSLFSGSYSHVYEFFCLSGVYYCIVKFGRIFEYKYMALAGLFSGLLVLVRPVDLVMLIPICIYILKYLKPKAWINFFIPVTICSLIFFLYNYISYGNPLVTGYSAFGITGFRASNFHILKLLFTDIRGWFIYSPAMLLGLIGILIYARKTLQGWLLYILPVTLLMTAYSFWDFWWSGDSLGQRFFIVLVPTMTIGIAYLLQKLTKPNTKLSRIKFIFTGLLIILSFYSLLILVAYRFAPINEIAKSVNTKYLEVPVSERYSATSILKYHVNLVKSSNSFNDYWNKLDDGLTGGRSVLMISLGMTQPILKAEVKDGGFALHIIPDPASNRVVTDINFSNGNNKYSIIGIDFSKYSILDIKCQYGKCQMEKGGLIELNPESEINLIQAKKIKVDGSEIIIYVNSSVKLK